MKRDMDLIRKILFEIEKEAKPDFSGIFANEIAIEGYSQEIVTAHIILLYDAGLLFKLNSEVDPRAFLFQGLSWEGYEFLESIKPEQNWKKIQNTLKDSMAFSAIKSVGVALITAYAKSELGL